MMGEKVLTQSKLKSIALPAQHGGWGFLVEPILLGLLTAPSWASFWISAAAVSAFLLQHPTLIVIKDLRRKRSFERTQIAGRFGLLFGSLAFLFLILAFSLAGPGFVPPLLMALPLALTHLWYETRNEGRRLVPEIVGALALGAVASMIAFAAGKSWVTAFALWMVMGLRVVPSILYVRVRLRMKHGYKPAHVVPVAAHILALVGGLILYLMGIVSALYFAAVGLLFIRAIAGLRYEAQVVPARTIGFQEVAFGLLYTFVAAIPLIGSF